MESPGFVYVTYIQSTPERVWEALTDPKFTARRPRVLANLKTMLETADAESQSARR